jgi:hypothetical protein
VSLAALIVITTRPFPLRGADARPSLLTHAKVVAAAYDQASGQGTIYLAQHGILKPIFSDHRVLNVPVISPSGSKIAFNRQMEFGVADGDIVVTDLSGHVLSSILIDKVTPGVNYARTQGIESLAWMGEDRLAASGIANPTVTSGFILHVRPSSLEHPQANGSDPKDGWFMSNGPSAVSPLGTHLVTVSGLSQSFPYSSCAGDDAYGAGETLEIDGVYLMPPSLKKLVVIAPFSWADETRFSTIVRYSRGLAVLTARAIPLQFRTEPGKSARAGDPPGPPNILNPPEFDVVPLPLRQADIPSAVFEGFYDRAGRYRFRQYVQSNPAIVANWTLAGTSLTKSSARDVAADPAEAGDAAAKSQSIAADMRDLTDRLRIPISTISSENVWCKDVQCGALAVAGASNAVPIPEGAVEVPDICQEK